MKLFQVCLASWLSNTNTNNTAFDVSRFDDELARIAVKAARGVTPVKPVWKSGKNYSDSWSKLWSGWASSWNARVLARDINFEYEARASDNAALSGKTSRRPAIISYFLDRRTHSFTMRVIARSLVEIRITKNCFELRNRKGKVPGAYSYVEA